MNSQDFLTLNLVGAGAFVVWYLLSRGGEKTPTRLDMKAKDSAPPLIEPEPPVATREVGPAAATRSAVHPDLQGVRPKNLNVIFSYNSHTWDAYEVLGVPAGASIKTVTEAYQTQIRRCDKASIEFLETAYNAILNKK
ncbi:J domain-containing protein [Bdellovibrio sp. HCB185ZH]|uniref:J domain-containing protein n=1 Tax=Bdellovibrio sp. HCB185ZH TaxID=3394235 RepID=UPI0039A513F7